MTFREGFSHFIHFFRLDKKSPFVYDWIDATNMRAAIPVAVYTLITERAMYNRTVMLWGLIPKDLYNAAFIVLAAASVQLLVFAVLYLSGRLRSHKAASISSYLFFICCTIIGQGIALYNYAIGKQVILFLPMVAWIFALFLVNPVSSMLFSWISFRLIPDYTNNRIVLSNYADRIMVVFALMLLVISVARWISMVRAAEAEEQLRLMNEKLSDTSIHDELTGVRNRHALHSDLPRYMNRNLIVMMSDIDDFKYYNDSFGHDTGDVVLRHMAETLSRSFGRDSVYRFGGDEFLLVLPEWDEEDLVAAVSEWKTRFRHFVFEGKTLHLASTAGYAVGNCGSEEQLSQMISLADAMLYEGKMTHKGSMKGTNYDPSQKQSGDLKKLENSLRSGETDTLTALPNMMYFRSKADLTADILRASGKKPVLAYFNIDHFKDYNRKYGFEAGDAVLIKLAAILSEEFDNDLVCRLADDRFVLIATKDNIEGRITSVSAKFRKLAPDSRIALRAGLYELQDDSVDVSLACDCAQQALYGMRRTTCAWYDDEMRRRLEKRQYISDHLDEALEKGWIENLYQPIIRSVNRLVCGMEVLPRWNDPKYGILPPEDYVPVLEESHMIHRHDYYVLKQACRDFSEYRKRGYPAIPIVINLSFRDLDRDSVVESIEELTAGIDRSMVNFDISAASLKYLNPHIEETLLRLGKLGYQIWMDGFGKGNSTIDILIHHLIQGIKLDLRSIHGIGTDSAQRVFLDHVVNMCKEMNIATLALGVENEAEATYLSELGCEYMQGFWFSSNLTFEECCTDRFLKEFHVEPPEKRAYYSAISRVDLSSPTRLDYDRHIELVSNDLPAAVCELRDGRFSTCISNSAFRGFLKTRNIDSIEAYDRLMNDRESYLYGKLLNMTDAAVHSNRWETVKLGSNDNSYVCSFHTIAKDGDEAVSVIGVVVNMKLYKTAA